MKHSVLDYLEIRALARSAKKAVICEDDSCTYFELLELSQRIGANLNALDTQGKMGVEGGSVIVFMEKSIPTLGAFFGILQAGGFYVPVDPSVPHSRLQSIYETLGGPYVVVAENTKAAALEALPKARLVSVESLMGAAASDQQLQALSAIRTRRLSTDPCYVLFTSGSTGAPKGVAVSHGSILDFIDTFAQTFAFDEDDILGNQAPFDFDVSVKDIYTALATGATLCIIPRALFSTPADLVDYINKNQVTSLTWAVSALCLVSSLHGLDYAGIPTVRRVLFSGEVMPYKHLRTWMERLPQASFGNLYGPTEITCNCTYHLLDPQRDYVDGIPLGIAFANRTVLLLDDQNKEVVEPGQLGEICVCGPSVALGYIGRPDLTERVFVQNPIQTQYFQRMYRTGDLAYRNEAGEMFFSGRKDNQIKHMGHRIELEEIDIAFEQQEGITRCRSVFDSEKSRIYSFYEGNIEEADVMQQVQQTIPVYMIPNALVKVDDMPLTKNGKVDRKALLAAYQEQKQREKEAKRAARKARAAAKGE